MSVDVVGAFEGAVHVHVADYVHADDDDAHVNDHVNVNVPARVCSVTDTVADPDTVTEADTDSDTVAYTDAGSN